MAWLAARVEQAETVERLLGPDGSLTTCPRRNSTGRTQAVERLPTNERNPPDYKLSYSPSKRFRCGTFTSVQLSDRCNVYTRPELGASRA